jgi:integrase
VLRDFEVIQKHAANGSDWPIGCIHDLRRTYCTLMADAVPMYVLRLWAGHSDIATTANFYLGLNDGMADRARKAFAIGAAG